MSKILKSIITAHTFITKTHYVDAIRCGEPGHESELWYLCRTDIEDDSNEEELTTDGWQPSDSELFDLMEIKLTDIESYL